MLLYKIQREHVFIFKPDLISCQFNTFTKYIPIQGNILKEKDIAEDITRNVDQGNASTKTRIKAFTSKELYDSLEVCFYFACIDTVVEELSRQT